MTTPNARSILTSGRAIGTWIKLAAPEVVEIAAYAGFDFIVIDLEHAMLDDRTVGTMIGTARLAGIVPLVRPSGADRAVIQRALDAGAAGIVVPRVEDVTDAERAVDVATFPPRGTRGLSTSGRAGGWGDMSPREYVDRGDDCVVVVQLESAEAVRQAVAIAAVPGVDAVFLGPMDLTASMGRPFCSSDIVELVAALEADCVRVGAVLGTAVGTDPAAAAGMSDAYRFLVVGSDASMLRAGAQAVVRAARSADRFTGAPPSD